MSDNRQFQSANRQFQANGLPVKTRAEVLEGLRFVLARQLYGAESAGLVAYSTAISPDLLAQAIRELEALGSSVTEREAVLRERKAFEAGAMWVASSCYTGPQSLAKMAADNRTQWAREVYPLPVRRRPIRVTLSNGKCCYRQELPTDHDAWFLLGLKHSMYGVNLAALRSEAVTADDFEKIARMLRDETEEVPEGEE